MNVWLPYGLKIMHSIDSLLREYSGDSGIEEVSFPVLISREIDNVPSTTGNQPESNPLYAIDKVITILLII